MKSFRYGLILVIIFSFFFSNTSIAGTMHKAIRENRLPDVKYFVESGYIELPDRNGMTPLVVAVYNGRTRIVRYLCEKGANVNAIDDRGWTALMYAAYYNFVEIAELLLAHDADKNMKNNKGFTAFYYAKKFNHNEISPLLKHELSVKQDIIVAKVSSRVDQSGLEVAIFPWVTSSGTHKKNINAVILENIISTIESEKNFYLVSSFYKTGKMEYDNNTNLNTIDKSTIWAHKKPDLLNICKYGQALSIDTVIIGSYYVDGRIYDLKIYLIDIKSSKMFSATSYSMEGLSSYHGTLQSESLDLTRKVFRRYKKDFNY